MKSTRLAVLAAAAVLLSAAAAVAAPATTTSNVNVRSGPGTNFAVIDVLRSGDRVDAQCGNGPWCEVSIGRLTGWVSRDFLAFNVNGGPAIQPPIIVNPPRPPIIVRPPVQPPIIVQPPRPPRPPIWGGPGPFPGNPGGPRPPRPPVYENAEACFYAQRNFNGPSFCVDQGETLDRLPRNWDDSIRSVELFGGAEVDICSDRNLYGACQTLRSSTPRLNNAVDRNGSSVEVY